MKVIYTFLVALAAILTQFCIQYARRKDAFSTKSLVILHVIVMHALSNYTIFVWVKNPVAANIFYSFYSINVPWLIICVLGIALYLTYFNRGRKLLKVFTIILLVTSILDGANMILNIFFRHAFSFSILKDAGGHIYWLPEYKTGYWIHLAYCYILSLGVCVLFIKKSVKASRIYRMRYLSMVLNFAVCLILNGVFMYSHMRLDFSVILYGLIAAFTNYISLKSIPDDLIQNMMTKVSENIKNGIACFDMNGICIYQNRKARVIFRAIQTGTSAAEDMRRKIIEENSRDGQIPEITVEEKIKMNSGEHTFTVEYKEFIDSKNRKIGSYLKLDDRTAEIHALEQEIYNGSHDSVTGLYNRRAFFEKAREIIQEKPDVSRLLIATDIENFKLVNDLLGTDIGDKILKAQAKMLTFAKYDGCIQGRISADRFAMLINKENFNQRFAVMNTKNIQHLVPEIKFQFRMYIGVYEIKDPEEAVDIMFDKACRAIKSIHGNYELSLATFDSSLVEKDYYEKTLINSFDEALAENRFLFFLQPVVNAESGEIEGAEALARWNHTAFGLIEPDTFLPVLEKTDAIFKMDSFIWRSACAKLKEWKEMGRDDLFISVNISTKDFYFGDIYEIFSGLVKEYGINPEKLRLEVTESVIMKNLKFYGKIIGKLRDSGFQVEMDDFGSGYSSISTLKNIPMDVLKLDIKFLNFSSLDEKKIEIIRQIIKMALALNMTVVAEGVENQEQVKLLREMKCNLLQGFYFSKPISMGAFELKYIKGGRK